MNAEIAGLAAASSISCGREVDEAQSGSCKIPARSGTGPVAQRVFKAGHPPTRSNPPQHDRAGFAGVSHKPPSGPNTLRHGGIGFSCGREMDEARRHQGQHR